MQIDQAYARLNLVQDFIPAGNSNRPGRRLVPQAITIHNTDNTGRTANAAAHARYQKGPDARRRQVSWHFTVDDGFVYQSLPTNEIGWHAGRGNISSIGVEICMNAGLDEAAAYERAALLTAVLAFQHGITVPHRIRQHYDWTEKNCPRILRGRPGGWGRFLDRVKTLYDGLTEVRTATLVIDTESGAHLLAGKTRRGGAKAKSAKTVRLSKASPKKKRKKPSKGKTKQAKSNASKTSKSRTKSKAKPKSRR